MSQMIPLKIADMAVESCNKEIARLLFEKAELQGRVIALEAQLESEKAAYKALRASSFVTAVPSEDYEKLKADLEKSDAVVFTQAVENERLKAELERLTHLANQSEFYRSQLQKDTCLLENIHMQDAFKHYEAENARLKAELERLRKAGTEMGKHLPDTDEANRAYIDFEAGGRSS